MVHKIKVCNLKFLRLTESYVCTLFSHSSFRSSINDHRYTSISLLGAFRSKINSDIKINSSFMYLQGDTLYTTSIIGHMLQKVLKLSKRLNPSIARPSRILCGSLTKCGYFASKSFHTTESIRWQVCSPLEPTAHDAISFFQLSLQIYTTFEVLKSIENIL